MLADAATRARVQPQHKLFGETLAKLSCAKSRNQMGSDREDDARCFVLTPCVQDPAPLLEVPASCRFQETEAGEDENRHSVVVKERHISDTKKKEWALLNRG
jgi:hypothetical protein